jgi:hypothetical protein
MLSGIAFYFLAASYLDAARREQMKALTRIRPFPDIWFVGTVYAPVTRKSRKPEKVDWQQEGF